MLTGNREFNESYENYKNLILKTAYTYSGNREAAEDITQETFLKLYIGYDSMKKENTFMAVYHCENMALNYKKRQSGKYWRWMMMRVLCQNQVQKAQRMNIWKMN